MLCVQTGLKCVDYLCIAADGSRLAVSQLSGGREVWSAPFDSTSRIQRIAETRWPGKGPIDERRKSWWPGAMCKLVLDPAGGLLDAGVLATVPSLADPRGPLSLDGEAGETSLAEADLYDFRLSPDSNRLLTATGNMEGYEYCCYLKNWSVSTGTWALLWTVASDSFDIHAVAFLPNQARVLVVEDNLGRDCDRPNVSKYSSLLTLRDDRTGDLITESYPARPFDELQQLAVGGAEPSVVLGYPNQLHVYGLADLAADPCPCVIRTDWPNLRGMVFHPSGRFLLTVAEGSTVSLWETNTWTIRQEFDWKIGNLRSVGVSLNGYLAAVGSDSGVVTVWDWEV